MVTNDVGKRVIRFGVIGCGLMGREFASAAARWCHLLDMDVEPRIDAVCDANLKATEWFSTVVPTVKYATADYMELLDDPDIDAIYCAVPHNLHASIYGDIIRKGKHLLGEKPFGIDLRANREIAAAAEDHPGVLVRGTSEFPFYPGAYQIMQWMTEKRFGKIIEAEAGFWHSSDLNPHKPMNWKRRVETNGEYGCMGDLGMHVMHLPLHFGWRVRDVRALLTRVHDQRLDANGQPVNCETWDNANLSCSAVEPDGHTFPLTLSTKRIAPGHANSWFIRIWGTDFSAEFTTKNPKQVRFMTYSAGKEQAWSEMDISYESAYGTITGPIFEFGFSDSLLQMWAAFCDELASGDDMRSPIRCVTLEQTHEVHRLFTAALDSQRTGGTVALS